MPVSEAAALVLLGHTKSTSPSAPNQTIPDSIRNGVRTPEAEKKVTIIPFAAPADFENRWEQIE